METKENVPANFQENMEFVNNLMTRLELPPTHEPQLHALASKGLPEFNLTIPAERDGIQTSNELKFEFSKEAQRYYFNEWTSKITNLPDNEKASVPMTMHVNSIHQKNNLTLEESISLRLRGSVEKTLTYNKKVKEGETPQPAPEKSEGATKEKETVTLVKWKKMDFSQLNDKGQYPVREYQYPKLEEHLRQFSIDKKDDEDYMRKVLYCLRKGRVYPVKVGTGDLLLTRYLEVDAAKNVILQHTKNVRKVLNQAPGMQQGVESGPTVQPAANTEQMQNQNLPGSSTAMNQVPPDKNTPGMNTGGQHPEAAEKKMTGPEGPGPTPPAKSFTGQRAKPEKPEKGKKHSNKL